jgi:transcriptional regulator with XRE-family HTH domain
MHDSAKIRTLRERRGLTPAEAGELAGMTAQLWNDVESGSRASITLTTLEKIAKALAVKANDLLK